MDENEYAAFEEWREETPINEMLTGDELDMASPPKMTVNTSVISVVSPG